MPMDGGETVGAGIGCSKLENPSCSSSATVVGNGSSLAWFSSHLVFPVGPSGTRLGLLCESAIGSGMVVNLGGSSRVADHVLAATGASS